MKSRCIISGFYWVKLFRYNGYEVAYYDTTLNVFLFCGGSEFRSEDVYHVDRNRIERKKFWEL